MFLATYTPEVQAQIVGFNGLHHYFIVMGLNKVTPKFWVHSFVKRSDGYFESTGSFSVYFRELTPWVPTLEELNTLAEKYSPGQFCSSAETEKENAQIREHLDILRNSILLNHPIYE